jgi:hypothetical protein
MPGLKLKLTTRIQTDLEKRNIHGGTEHTRICVQLWAYKAHSGPGRGRVFKS